MTLTTSYFFVQIGYLFNLNFVSHSQRSELSKDYWLEYLFLDSLLRSE